MITSRLILILIVTFSLIACTPETDIPDSPRSTSSVVPGEISPPEYMTPTDVLIATTPTSTPVSSLPDWIPYNNEKCGFEIQLPPGAIIAPESDELIRIDLPFLEGTNLREKYLEVSCRDNIVPCISPPATDYPPDFFTSELVEINGVSFEVQGIEEGAAGNFYAWQSFTKTIDKFCLSLVFNFHSLNAFHFDPPIPEFDEELERQVIQEIMATFNLLR